MSPKRHVKAPKYVVREIGTPEPVKGRKHLDVQVGTFVSFLFVLLVLYHNAMFSSN